MKMTDDNPDWSALTIAGTIFGGTPNSQLFQRIRVQNRLSYGAGASTSMPTKDGDGSLSGYSISGP